MKKLIPLLIAALSLASAHAGADDYSRSAESTVFSPIGSGVKAIDARRTAERAPHGNLPLRQIQYAEAEGITVPFTHTLGKDEISTNTALYTFIDANNDERSWKIGGFTGYSVCMKPTADGIDTMDDWLMSPAIRLEGGKTYQIMFDARCVLSSGTEDVLDIHVGSSADIEDMQTSPAFTATLTSNSWDTFTTTITVDADGLYVIGFHAVSQKSTSGNIGLCNFAMSVATGDDPEEQVDAPAAGEIEYQVYPYGQLKAHVKYTAPTKTVSGADLAKIDKVEIINRWYEKLEYEDVTPGQAIELDVDLFSGKANNRLQATAYVKNSKGEYVAGEETLVTGIMAGYDYPLAPENVKAIVSPDGKQVRLSWSKVSSVGEEGGYVPTDNITYYIFDAFGSWVDPAIASTTSNSYIFDYSDLEEQDFFAYQVTASYEYEGSEYASYATNSNIVTAGPMLQLPFAESFANNSFQHTWAIDPQSSYTAMAGTVADNYLELSDEDGASTGYLNSQDGDNGFFFFLPVEKDDMYGLMSLASYLPATSSPIVLEFYAQGKGSVIDVIVNCEGKSTVENTFDFMENPTDGWTLFSTDMAKYAGKAVSFEIRFRGVHNDDEHTWSIPLDNIRLRTIAENDLAISSLSVPGSVKAGEEFGITAKIENLGSNAPIDAAVELYRDGALVATHSVSEYDAFGASTVNFTDAARLDDNDQIAYKAVLVCDDDNADNNQAETIVIVNFPKHPMVEGLDGSSQDGVVTLSWNAVTLDGTEYAPITEDFENPDYEPLTISDFGGWSMVDMDGMRTYTFLNDVNNPFRTMPMAYQLYNPIVAGVPTNYLIDCDSHSGSTMLVAWSCQGMNQNLLISPALSGEAQTISFWAKSFSIAYGEEIMVYASSTGTNIADFTKVDVNGNFITIGGYDYVPEEWTEYTVDLPAGTKHFAILHCSYDSYALYLDDITYTPEPMVPADTELLGYNVYRNGVKANDSVVTETTYSETPSSESGVFSYDYRVSAVYNNAESRHSSPVTVSVTMSGIHAIGGSGQSAELFSIDGRKANNPTSGFYLRRQGTKAEKVVIR